MAIHAHNEYRDPITYGAKKRKLKAMQEEWWKRLSAARGQGPEGYVSPSRLRYGQLLHEYVYARDLSRWWRGFERKPRRRE
jgi:hypothetical protein